MKEGFINKPASPERDINIEKIATANFNIWNSALQTKDPIVVADLYTEDATFLPTVSGDFKKGRAGAKEYFEHFLEKNPEGKIIDAEIQPLGPDLYLHSGMYNFIIGPDDARHLVEARFTLVWEKNKQGVWNIIHHHSSIRPKE